MRPPCAPVFTSLPVSRLRHFSAQETGPSTRADQASAPRTGRTQNPERPQSDSALGPSQAVLNDLVRFTPMHTHTGHGARPGPPATPEVTLRHPDGRGEADAGVNGRWNRTEPNRSIGFIDGSMDRSTVPRGVAAGSGWRCGKPSQANPIQSGPGVSVGSSPAHERPTNAPNGGSMAPPVQSTVQPERPERNWPCVCRAMPSLGTRSQCILRHGCGPPSSFLR